MTRSLSGTEAAAGAHLLSDWQIALRVEDGDRRVSVHVVVPTIQDHPISGPSGRRAVRTEPPLTSDPRASGLTLRLATIDDRDALVTVHAASRELAYASHLPDALLRQYSLDDQRAFWLTRLAGDDPNATTWVAMVDGELVGFCHAGSIIPDPSVDALHVHSLYVSPDHQSRGLGRALLERMLITIAAGGYPRATLHVYGFNEPAQRFYEHLGWRRAATVELLRWEGDPVIGHRYEKVIEPPDATVPTSG